MHGIISFFFLSTYAAIINWLRTDGDELLALIVGLLNVLSWLFLALFIVTQVCCSVIVVCVSYHVVSIGYKINCCLSQDS